MKETRTINLNGLVFHIDDDAYQNLRNYLHDIEVRLPEDERVDVMTDIEARICELLQSALFAKNVQVADAGMIESIKARIGAPSDFGENKRPKVKQSALSERGGCGRVLKISLYVILILVAIQIMLPVLAVVFAICMAGLGLGIGAFSTLPLIGTPFFDGHWGLALLTVVSALVAVCLPVYALIHTIVSFMRTRKGPKGRFWLVSAICWAVSIACFTTALYKQSYSFTDWYEVSQVFHQWDDADDYSEPAVVALPYFNAVNVSGAMEVEIGQGAQNVAVSDSDMLHVEVKDSVLYISVKDDFNRLKHVEVTLPDLTSLSLSGASKAEVEGTFQEVRYMVSGASKLDAEDAKAMIVHVNCSGASKASVYAEKELWAQASGASKITYSGNAEVKRNLAVGASKIKKD